jgi:hypothetical protein
MGYRIAVDHLEDIKGKLDKLSNKASRYDKHLSYTVGRPYPFRVVVKVYDEINHCLVKTGEEFTVECVDIDIDTDIISINGWKVCAHIEHTDAGNIVTAINNHDINQSWYAINSNCDHCSINRYRKVTYIVQHETGNYKQVGSTCLKDYTGIDPELVLAFNIVSDEFVVDDNIKCFDYMRGCEHVYSSLEIIALSIDCISEKGYVKSSDIGSTKEQVITKLSHDEKASEQATKKAQEIITFISEYSGIDNILNNCKALVLSELCKIKHFGILAYSSIAVQREQERQAEKQVEIKESEFIGTIGERRDIMIKDCILLTSFNNQYGTTYLYKLMDEHDNVCIWFASNPFEKIVNNNYERFISGKIKATIKDQSIRDGVKQTILTRVKAIENETIKGTGKADKELSDFFKKCEE